MQLENVMRIINDIEARLPVDEWTVKGIKVWPLIRIHLNIKLSSHDEPCFNTANIEEKTRFKKLLDFGTRLGADLLALYQDSKHNQKIHNTQGGFLFVSDANDRRVKINNAWYDIYCSPLIEEAKKNNRDYVFLEYCANQVYKFPRFENTCLIELEIKLLKIRSRLFSNKNETTDICLKTYSQLEQYLFEIGHGDCHLNLSDLLQKTNTLIIMSAFFQKILLQTNPSVGVVVSYYGITEMAFVLACHRENISVIDMQHGVQGPLHAAYGRWHRIPAEGYDLLPNLFAVWSDFEKAAIDEWAVSHKRYGSFVLGNIWNEMWRRPETSNIVDFLNQDQPNLYISECKAKVLYTLQPEVETPRFLIDVIKNTPDVQWLIRIHPCMIKNEEKIYSEWVALNQGNLFIRELTYRPLPEILNNIDLHITMSSSVVIDALMFSVPSIVIDRLGKELYKHIIEDGNAFFCSNSKEILEVIDSVSASPTPNLIRKQYDLYQSLIDLEKTALEVNI